MQPTPFSDAQESGRNPLIQSVISALGPFNYWETHIGVCNDFLPDPPVFARLSRRRAVGARRRQGSDQGSERRHELRRTPTIISAPSPKPRSRRRPRARPFSTASQAGPALLQALAAYSVQKEQGDAVDRFVGRERRGESGRLARERRRCPTSRPSRKTKRCSPCRRRRNWRACRFRRSPDARRSASTSPIPSARSCSRRARAWRGGPPTASSSSVTHVFPQTRDLGAVKLSLDFLATRSVGELNIAFRSTLDAFSYRLDAWITARANRRLEQMRAAQPTGLYVGGYAWVENLKADDASRQRGLPARAVAGAGGDGGDPAQRLHGESRARRLRHRARLQADAPRERHPAGTHARPAARGALRLSHRARAARRSSSASSSGRCGSRTRGVRWAADRPTRRPRRSARATSSTALPCWPTGKRDPAPSSESSPPRWQAWIRRAPAILPGEQHDDRGHHRRRAGPGRQRQRPAAGRRRAPDRPGQPGARGGGDGGRRQADAADRERRSGARRAAARATRSASPCVCPDPVAGWPDDRRSRAEPALNAWIATMLGDPAATASSRACIARDADGHDVIDALPIVATWDDLGLSPLSAVLLAEGVVAARLAGPAETGLRSAWRRR